MIAFHICVKLPKWPKYIILATSNSYNSGGGEGVHLCSNFKHNETRPNFFKLISDYFYLPTRYLFQLLSKDQMSPVCSTRYTYLSRMKKISDDHGSHKSFISFTFTFLLPLSLIFMALKKIDDL